MSATGRPDPDLSSEQEARRARCRREFDAAMAARNAPVTWLDGRPFVCRKHPELIGQVIRTPAALQWSVFREAWAHGFAACEEEAAPAAEAAGTRPALRLVGDGA